MAYWSGSDVSGRLLSVMAVISCADFGSIVTFGSMGVFHGERASYGREDDPELGGDVGVGGVVGVVVGVGVAVGVTLGFGVAVAVGAGVGVAVAVGTGEEVGVGVGDDPIEEARVPATDVETAAS